MPDRKQEESGHPDEAPSKSARKREMHRLQDMGEALTKLNDQQLESMPLDNPALLLAIQECRRIRSNSARKRHLQYIGKLMRALDPETLEDALQKLHSSHRQENNEFQQLEQLRDDVLAAGVSGIELVMSRFHHADRQHLRQLVLQHQRELQRKKPLAASRKLFRYLRDLQENPP